MPTSQSSVGQQVEAQAVAEAMAGDRAYHEVRFPATGDFETELINMVNAFIGNYARQSYPSDLSHERFASVFDYLAKRYRDLAREMEIHRKNMASTQQAGPFSYPTVPKKTASEVLAIERQMRGEMKERMLSAIHKSTMR